PAPQSARARGRQRERELGRDGTDDVAVEPDRRHHLPRPAVLIRDHARDDVALSHLPALASGEWQPAWLVAGGDDVRAGLVEAEDVELKDALPHGHDLPDLVLEQRAVLELAAVADRRGHLPGEDDRPPSQIFLEPPARAPDLQPR